MLIMILHKFFITQQIISVMFNNQIPKQHWHILTLEEKYQVVI